MSLLCFAGVAQAQQTNKTFRFVEKHADGTTKEIPDGSTLNYTAADAEETPFGTQIKPALYVENTTGDLKAIALTLKSPVSMRVLPSSSAPLTTASLSIMWVNS